jgi:DNA-binding GntR family transcriptional regulator
MRTASSVHLSKSRTGDRGRIRATLRASRITPQDVRTVREVLFERLRGLILSGHYSSGAKLREQELAHAFGVSRTPVREALRKLESEGLVHYLPHRGVVVNQISYDDLAEIYPMRAVIEGLAARLAARRITPQELAALKDLQRQMNALLTKGDYRRATRVHTRFNMVLYRATGNRRLIGILAQFNDYIEHTIGRAFALPGRAAEIRREHEAMLNAIEARNGDAAEQAARRHVENARRAFAGEPRQPV